MQDLILLHRIISLALDANIRSQGARLHNAIGMRVAVQTGTGQKLWSLKISAVQQKVTHKIWPRFNSYGWGICTPIQLKQLKNLGQGKPQFRYRISRQAVNTPVLAGTAEQPLKTEHGAIHDLVSGKLHHVKARMKPHKLITFSFPQRLN